MTKKQDEEDPTVETEAKKVPSEDRSRSMSPQDNGRENQVQYEKKDCNDNHNHDDEEEEEEDVPIETTAGPASVAVLASTSTSTPLKASEQQDDKKAEVKALNGQFSTQGVAKTTDNDAKETDATPKTFKTPKRTRRRASVENATGKLSHSKTVTKKRKRTQQSTSTHVVMHASMAMMQDGDESYDESNKENIGEDGSVLSARSNEHRALSSSASQKKKMKKDASPPPTRRKRKPLQDITHLFVNSSDHQPDRSMRFF